MRHEPEAESREKQCVWDPASPYVHSRVDSNTFTMGIGQPYARVNFNSMPESTFSPSQGLWIWPLVMLRVKKRVQGQRMEVQRITAQQTQIDLSLSRGSVHGSYCSNIE
jgi:hypothetical protein